MRIREKMYELIIEYNSHYAVICDSCFSDTPEEHESKIYGFIDHLIANGVTIEAEPVRHGRWIERLDGDGEFVHHMCSECKADAFFQYIIEADWDENIDGEWYNRGDEITGIEEFLTDYCTHCGARMDGDDDATN